MGCVELDQADALRRFLLRYQRAFVRGVGLDGDPDVASALHHGQDGLGGIQLHRLVGRVRADDEGMADGGGQGAIRVEPIADLALRS